MQNIGNLEICLRLLKHFCWASRTAVTGPVCARIQGTGLHKGAITQLPSSGRDFKGLGVAKRYCRMDSSGNSFVQCCLEIRIEPGSQVKQPAHSWAELKLQKESYMASVKSHLRSRYSSISVVVAMRHAVVGVLISRGLRWNPFSPSQCSGLEL